MKYGLIKYPASISFTVTGKYNPFKPFLFTDLSGKIDLSFNWTFDIGLGWVTVWGGCKISLSAICICIIGLLPGNNFGSSGLSHAQGIGNLGYIFLIPGLSWPILGLTWYWSFDLVGTCNCTGVTNGFIICFSGFTFGSIPLSTPCYFGEIVPPDFAQHLVWIKCSFCSFSCIFQYLACSIFCILKDTGMISWGSLSSGFFLDQKYWVSYHKDCMILNADKGVTLVVMDRQDYIRNAKELLEVTTTYRLIQSDPNNKLKTKPINTLKNIRLKQEWMITSIGECIQQGLVLQNFIGSLSIQIIYNVIKICIHIC